MPLFDEGHAHSLQKALEEARTDADNAERDAADLRERLEEAEAALSSLPARSKGKQVKKVCTLRRLVVVSRVSLCVLVSCEHPAKISFHFRSQPRRQRRRRVRAIPFATASEK